MANKRFNKSIAVDTDVAVGRDLSVSRNATVTGNLKVSGWLDAHNIKEPNKGFFPTPEALAEAYPTPRPGWWALVGESIPAEIYRCDQREWLPTGIMAGEIYVQTEPTQQPSTDPTPGNGGFVNGGQIDPGEIEITIDRQLDISSTNAISNSAVTAELNALDARIPFRMEAPLNDERTEVQLRFINRRDELISSVDIPVGQLGGTGTAADTTDILFSVSVDHPVVKDGAAVALSYQYDQVYVTGSDTGLSTGSKATVSVRLVRGEAEVYSATIPNVTRGTHTIDLTPHLALGRTEIYLTVRAKDPTTGVMRTKQRYTEVFVSALTLKARYDLADTIADGGYTGIAEIPFEVGGSGTKRVVLWLDGEQHDTRTVSGDSVQVSSFRIDMSALAPGRHSVQLRAETTIDVADGTPVTLRSESIWIDLLRRGTDTPIACVMCTDTQGRIAPVGERPHTSAVQYDSVQLAYAVYHPARQRAVVQITASGESWQVSAPREQQQWTYRFSSVGEAVVAIAPYPLDGGTSATVIVDVAESSVSAEVTRTQLVAELRANGRSNQETDPAVWTSGEVSCTFEGVDWLTTGWTGEALRLINGAKAVIGYNLFGIDAATTGLTLEAELRVTNVTDPDAPVLSCIHDGKGVLVTGTQAQVLTGAWIPYTDEDGNNRTREVKMASSYVCSEATNSGWIKLTVVVHPASECRLMELYADGNRVAADTYDEHTELRHAVPQPISITSVGADVEVRSVLIYRRTLSDDEVLDNSIADSADIATMVSRYTENDVLGEGATVDMQKLSDRGRGIIRIVHNNTDTEKGTGALDDVFATNNKKTDFLADVYYFPSTEARTAGALPFVASNCYIRIQGTSSTKYPSKNIRIYLTRGSQALELTVDGEIAQTKEYALRRGTPAQSVLCAKADYSDSSMSLNTGGAKLFNSVMREIGLLTPPQAHQRESGGESAITARAAIDGWPVDVFAAHTLNGANTYYGQYNLNNEKSQSGAVFGMTGIPAFYPECPLAFEALNNGEAMCLMQCHGATEAETEAWMAESFDSAFEVNYSSHGADGDVKWASMNAVERAAVMRLWRWIASCVPTGADPADIPSWRSEKFVAEAADYFDVDYLLTYYIWTDYFLAVDQRAKNILWRTWDGRRWYPTYYDGDTQMGKSNDSFMSYGYATTRDTWDAVRDKYAFEGRDSWLWCLVLANMEQRLRSCAARLRSTLTNQRVLDMLNGEQAGSWSDRVYNKSGYIKYIRPALERVYGRTWSFIYALQGKNRPHREYMVRNRFAVLDARYCCGTYRDDNIDFYLSLGAGDTCQWRVLPSEAYAFGYSTNNPNKDNAVMGDTGVVSPPEWATVEITGGANGYTVNDPLRFYGASRIRCLDLRGASGSFKNGLILNHCTALEQLDLSVPDSAQASTGWWLELDDCRRLRRIDLRGQRGARTGGASSGSLNFGSLSRLEWLDARGVDVQAIITAPGAPLLTLRAEGLQSLTLSGHRQLTLWSDTTAQGLDLGGIAGLRQLSVTGCPELDVMTLVQQWLSTKTAADEACTLTLDNVAWILDDATTLLSMAALGSCSVRGAVTVTCALSHIDLARLEHAFPGCFDGSGDLSITHTGELIILNDTDTNPAFFAAMKTVLRAKGISVNDHYLTQSEAAAVTALTPDAFAGNAEITSADELRYFTGLSWINDRLFRGCPNLVSVILPEGPYRIYSHAFAQCPKLQRVEISSTIAVIENYVFVESAMLSELVMHRTSAPSVSGSAFGDNAANFTGYTSKATAPNTLRVPTGATGYDTGVFANPLCNPDKCGFTLSYY